MSKSRKRLIRNNQRYKSSVYIGDGVYGNRYTITSYHPSRKEAFSSGMDEIKEYKRQADHSLIHTDLVVSFNKKKYKLKNRKEFNMFGGTKVKNRRGRTVTLLNPAEKGKKYAHELKTGFNFTNAGKVVTDEDGPLPLNRAQKAFRSGYLKSRSDSSKAYKYNKAKRAKSRKKKSR